MMKNIMIVLFTCIVLIADVIAERTEEFLEYYPLHEMKMKGVIEYDGKRMAIIHVDDLLHIAEVGNYLGKNNGVIKEILKDRIVIEECKIVDSANVKSEKSLTFDYNNEDIEFSSKTIVQNTKDVLSINIHNTSLKNLLLILMDLAEKNAIVASSIQEEIGFSAANTPWNLVIETILKNNNLQMVEVCGINLISKKSEFESVSKKILLVPPDCLPGDKVSFHFVKIALSDIFKLMAEFKEKSIQLDPLIQGQFAIRTYNQSWLLLFTLIAYLHDLHLEIDNNKIVVMQ